MYRKTIYTLLLIGAALPLLAQFGFSGHYQQAQASDWERPDGLHLPGNGWQAGVDYWFRLKNVRIEFLPTLSVGQLKPAFSGADDYRLGLASLFFNTNIYLFDLAGDCDCPTFSKQGPTLQKGFFLQLGPGISALAASAPSATGERRREYGFSAGINGAIGFDLGLSDVLTITPVVGLKYYPRMEWTALAGTDDRPTTEQLPDKARVWLPYAGLRLGFRLDQR